MRLRSPALVAFAGRACGQTLRQLFRTLKNDIHMPTEARPYDAYLCQAKRFLYSSWHDSAVIAAYGGRHTRTVALTSRHRDGSFTENLLKAANVDCVRGSTGRSGASAARALMETAKEFDIVITPDGPRGPRRVVSKGIVYLASKTGNGIAPTAFACENAWDLKGSWTTLTIPKPFSRLVSLVGPTIYVPADLDRDGIEEYRLKVQAGMESLQAKADRMIGNAEPETVTTTRVAA